MNRIIDSYSRWDILLPLGFKMLTALLSWGLLWKPFASLTKQAGGMVELYTLRLASGLHLGRTAGYDIDINLLGSNLSPEDGGTKFLRNVGTYLLLYIMLLPRKATWTSSQPMKLQTFTGYCDWTFSAEVWDNSLYYIGTTKFQVLTWSEHRWSEAFKHLFNKN
jgi:hypothetical protein